MPHLSQLERKSKTRRINNFFEQGYILATDDDLELLTTAEVLATALVNDAVLSGDVCLATTTVEEERNSEW